MAAVARLNKISLSNTISFASKFKLYKFLVTSILLYGSETWTLLADPERGSKLLKPNALGYFSASPILEHKTNDWKQSNINFFIGPKESLLATVEMEIGMVRACHTP